MGDRLELLRAELGLPPDPTWHRMHTYLYLDAVPPSFQVMAEPLPVRHPISIAVMSARL